jgi:hypothetical protein
MCPLGIRSGQNVMGLPLDFFLRGGFISGATVARSRTVSSSIGSDNVYLHTGTPKVECIVTEWGPF